MNMRWGYAIPRFYYVMTPGFILLDYVVGFNIRTAVLDAMPLYKNLYYGFCILCGVVVFVLPRASAVVALVESSIMVLITLTSVFLPLFEAIRQVMDLSGDWKAAEAFSIEGATNLMMSGSIAVVAFHLNLAALTARRAAAGRDGIRNP